MLTAKQNQKFPFHFLSAPPTEEKEMQGKIFGFCSRDRRVRSEYVELRKTLSILYSKCERCTAPVRSGRGARHLFWKNGGNQWDALRASHLLALKKPSSSILVLGTGLAPACPKGRYHLKVVRLLSFATRALLFFNMLCGFSDWRRDWFTFRFGRRDCGRQIGLFNFPSDIAARFRPHIIMFCPPDFGGF